MDFEDVRDESVSSIETDNDNEIDDDGSDDDVDKIVSEPSKILDIFIL